MTLTEPGRLRYVLLDRGDFDWEGDLSRTDLPGEFAEAVRAVEFDTGECAVCATPIGFYLTTDPETTRDSGTFAPYVAAQVSGHPVRMLCEPCAETLDALTTEEAR